MAEQESSSPNINVPSAGGLSSGFSKIKIKTVVVVILVAAIALGLYFLLGLGSNPKSIADQAQREIDAGNYDKAEEILKQGLEKHNNDSTLLAKLVQAIALEGNQKGQEENALKEAQPYIDEALRVGGEDPNVLAPVGYAYETASEYQKSFEFYDRVTQLDPKSGDAFFHRGHALEFLGKRQEAWKDYEKAYQLDPNNALVLMARGNMFFSQNKPQESYESFKKASEQPDVSNQTKAEALTGAALVRGSQENFKYVKESLDLSKQAVDADPNFSPALAAYGYNLFLTSPNLKDGIPYVEKAIAANPRITKNYLLLAQMYRAIQDYVKAINNLKTAISLVGNDNTILSDSDKNVAKGTYTYELAKTYYISGFLVNILPLLKDAVALNPSLKQTLKSDLDNLNLFLTYKDNQEFLSLIK